MEIAVLRHQVMVLRRQVRRPPVHALGPMVLARLARLLPCERWPVCLVAPGTLLRWHRELVARRWTYPSTSQRRGLDPDVVDAVLRLARENPRRGYLRIVGECRKLAVGGFGGGDGGPPSILLRPRWPRYRSLSSTPARRSA